MPKGARQLTDNLDIVILGLSLTSSWGNGHATTYRALAGALTGRGHRVLFLERDVPRFAENRDLVRPSCCDLQLYRSVEDLRQRFTESLHRCDLCVVGNTLSQSSLLVAVISFALGFSVLSRNVRNILYICFALLSTLVSVWALSFFLEKIWSGYGFYRLHLFFNVLLAPAGLILIRVMIRIQDKVSRRFLDISLFMAIALTLALLFHLEIFPWVRFLIYFSPVLIVFQTFQLMWIDLKLTKGHKRLPKTPTVGLGRRNLIYFGALIVLGTCMMDHVSWMGTALPSFGNLALAVYLFFISQAITQQRLLNISALISRFIVLLVVALTLTGLYLLLVAWIENSPGLFFLNSFIVSFLLLMLLDPLRKFVRYFTQILLTKTLRRLEQTLHEAQNKLTGIVDLGTLAQAVLLTAEQTLEPQWSALFVLRMDGTKFRRVRVSGREPMGEKSVEEAREIWVNHPLLQYCENLAKSGKFPVILDQILENEIDRSASRALREQYTRLIQGMKSLGGNLLIPLIEAGKMLGFVMLWVPSPLVNFFQILMNPFLNFTFLII